MGRWEGGKGEGGKVGRWEGGKVRWEGREVEGGKVGRWEGEVGGGKVGR